MDPNRKDALMQKFVKNYRKAIDNVTGSPRTVCFNPETLETSFGGTQSPGHIKDSSVIEKQRAALNARNATSSTSKGKPQMSLSKVTLSQEKPRTPQAKTSSDVGRTPVSVRKSEAVNSENVFVTPNKIPISSHRNQKDDGFRTPADKKTDLFRKSVSQTPDCFNSVTIGTPLNKTRARRSEELIQTENCGVTVAVRVRPFSTRELKEDCPPKCIISMYQNETTVVTEKGESHQFAYDHSFWSFDETGGEFASQDKVYQMLAQPILDKAIEGFNTCLFAYGQTGSGKSYSIMGHNEETGIIPRFCDEMFGRISVDRKKAKINVEISYFEIYNEKIHDLLGPTNKDKTGKKTNLKVREHPSLGIYVEGLSSYVVETFDDINGWLNVGNKHRATAATGMNDKSSRSHSVFTIVLTQTKTDTLDGVDHDHTITSKINLIDLAGSERQSLAKTSGERFREGASINTSLMTLGKVISLLSEQSTTNTSKKKKLYIPYRDSVLTWILKETLGGNSKTAMLATISPSSHHTEETLSTLRYAKQARSIMNAARVNEDPKARLIRELRATIERLKSQSGTMGDDGISASMAEIGMLREKLAERDREMMEMTKSWQEKLKKSEERKLEEARLLERSGIAFTVDNTLPNLVNLNEDPQLSEKLLYVLEQGKTRVGRAGARTDIHIQLTGPLIAEEHCTLEYLRKKVVITPIADALTYVNGNLIGDPTTLCHGDRVILGGDHYFRFGNPTEVVPGQRRSGAPKDFEFAHQELISAQNARLEAELEEARKKHEEELQQQESEAKARMETELARSKQNAEKQLHAQKNQYEIKLSTLEQQMRDFQKDLQQKQHESDQTRQQAQEAYHRLQRQKLVLEQEVLANRKRLELEEEAALKVQQESRVSHCKIVEQLEKEKQKIQEDVQKWTALRQQREAGGLTPRILTPRTPVMQDSSKKDLYRIMLNVREANKISQLLGQQTVFAREEVANKNELQPLIKVTNTKLGISTLWTLDRFENKLLQMREIYQQCDRDASATEAEDVFLDHNDTWEKDTRMTTPRGLSPRVLHSLRRRVPSDLGQKMTFNSISTPSSTQTRSSVAGTSRSTLPSIDSWTNMSASEAEGMSVLELCRDQITANVHRFTGVAFRENTADKVLGCCDTIRKTVRAVLEAYSAAGEQNETSREMFGEKLGVRVSGLEIAASQQTLLFLVSQWASLLKDGSAYIHELYDKLVSVVKKLSTQLVLFLQGCENDIESMVQESSAKLLDALYLSCRLCGELAIATETPLICLQDAPVDSLLTNFDEQPQLSVDTKHYITGGSDVFVDQTLSVSLKAVQDCDARAQALSGNKNSNCLVSRDVMRQVEMLTRSSKSLLAKLQERQMELDDNARLSCDSRGENYFHRTYLRNQGLVTHITGLTGGVSLLLDSTDSQTLDTEEERLHQIHRCAEMIESAATKLISASHGNTSTRFSSDSQIENSDISILSDSQLERLDHLSQEIKQASRTLSKAIHNSQHSSENGFQESGSKKRPLPLSPMKNIQQANKVSVTNSIVKRNLALFQH